MNIEIGYSFSQNGTRLLDGNSVEYEVVRQVRSTYNLSRNIVQLHIIEPEIPTPRTEASYISLRRKVRLIEALRAHHEVHIHRFNSPAVNIEQIIASGNGNHDTVGIIMQMPIPGHFMPLMNTVVPEKDIDSLNPSNAFWEYCATAEAALRVLRTKRYHLHTIAVVGARGFVGRDVVRGIQSDNLGDILQIDVNDPLDLIKNCEVIISTVGQPGLILGSHLSANAFLGIDIGNTRVGRRVAGDFDFASVDGKIDYLTPVPGGMGPLEMAIVTERIVKNAIDPNFVIDFTIR